MPAEAELVNTPVDMTVESAVAEPAAEWDGAWDKLDGQDWWKAVPETARGHFTKLREDHEAATSRSAYLDRLFEADDTTAALRTELETTRTELAGLKSSLTAVQGEAKTHQERAAALEARIAEQEADAAYDLLEAKYKDIFSDVHYLDAEKTQIDPNKGAFVRFTKLVQAGWSEEDAATAARALLTATPAAPAEPATPARPAVREAALPKSVAAATPGGNAASNVISLRDAAEDYDTRKARMKKEAEAG